MSSLGRTVGCFPSLETFMTPSDTMKTSPRGRSIQVNMVGRVESLVGETAQCLREFGENLDGFWFAVWLQGDLSPSSGLCEYCTCIVYEYIHSDAHVDKQKTNKTLK